MPEQEFLPPRRPAGFPGPDVPRGYQDEDPPPWAGLPSVRPSRPAPDYPMGSWQTAAPPPPRGQEQVPAWVGPDAAAEDAYAAVWATRGAIARMLQVRRQAQAGLAQRVPGGTK